jgi:hypothetical protein
LKEIELNVDLFSGFHQSPQRKNTKDYDHRFVQSISSSPTVVEYNRLDEEFYNAAVSASSKDFVRNTETKCK